MAQTVYNQKMALAYQGMIADVGYDNVVLSRAASGNVHVGVVVVGGPSNPLAPGPGQCAEMADNLAAFVSSLVGVSVYDSTRMPYAADANQKAQYIATDMVPVLTRGRIWVWTEVATALTDPVAVRNIAAGANTKGQFTNAVGAGFIAAPTGWHWMTATAGSGLIQLEIR